LVGNHLIGRLRYLNLAQILFEYRTLEAIFKKSASYVRLNVVPYHLNVQSRAKTKEGSLNLTAISQTILTSIIVPDTIQTVLYITKGGYAVAQILLPNQNQTPESDSPELNPTVKQQVADILEEVESEGQVQSPSHQAAPAQWGYRVPCAGVRYYSF
jgi:hypothetical protein